MLYEEVPQEILEQFSDHMARVLDIPKSRSNKQQQQQQQQRRRRQ
jgi:hypothetical protein